MMSSSVFVIVPKLISSIMGKVERKNHLEMQFFLPSEMEKLILDGKIIFTFANDNFCHFKFFYDITNHFCLDSKQGLH